MGSGWAFWRSLRMCRPSTWCCARRKLSAPPLSFGNSVHVSVNVPIIIIVFFSLITVNAVTPGTPCYHLLGVGALGIRELSRAGFRASQEVVHKGLGFGAVTQVRFEPIKLLKRWYTRV